MCTMYTCEAHLQKQFTNMNLNKTIFTEGADDKESLGNRKAEWNKEGAQG